MPIDAECDSCSTQYKIVDTAAGRRVKCRKCGSHFYVPGDAPIVAEPSFNLGALAELERRAAPVASEQHALIQYQAALSTVANPAAAAAADAPKRRGGKIELGKGGRHTSIKELAPDGVNFIDKTGPKKRPKGDSDMGLVVVLAVLLAGVLIGAKISQNDVLLRIARVAGTFVGIIGWYKGMRALSSDSWVKGLIWAFVPCGWIYYAITEFEQVKIPVMIVVISTIYAIVSIFVLGVPGQT